ncbi:glycerophosphodiester phosphodiesterase family protein [Mycoplasmopsis alligatoris]|uniref:Glycerophosphodiester phosphodiesterase family protein n=1 Tax=Mycoplasmopsis alligatoris A21JP2 TaxID=747682 RepID=D4XVF1_9BACT|nr:glycerophosphodiester phosphodiesterase family protein [Mycoplasmopsis alligatoris]EFF41600.1 glycerophosphodiester phosphodiesterase family protein [Mycoplasmopsis alligatoris A21JP2]
MKQILLAHRGYSGIAPENTRLAFDAALIFGFDGFEIDVHQTKDNVLVVIHDETTNRTAKSNRTVGKSTYKELLEDDHSLFMGKNLPIQRILTLEELLDLYIEHVQYLNIEIKTDVTEYEGIEENINNLMSKYKKHWNKIIFSSFNYNSLRRLYVLNPKLRYGFLWWKESQLKNINVSEMLSFCEFLHPWLPMYEKDKELYLSWNKKFCLWTIKSIQNFDKYKNDKNVFAQISNYKY